MLVSVSGSILLYKQPLLQWSYPQLQIPFQADLMVWARVLDAREQQEYNLARMPRPEQPWLELVRTDGSTEYWSAEGQLLLSRTAWGDWLAWCTQLHLYLFNKAAGHQLVGVVALLALVLIGLGLTISWPRRWNWRLFHLPQGANDGRRARHHHWLLGLITTPLLIWICVVGAAVVYSRELQSSLSWLLQETPVKAEKLTVAEYPVTQSQWQLWLAQAKQAVPDGQLRLVSFRKEAYQPQSFRCQLDSEWHPNGRTVVLLEPETGQVLQLNKATELPLSSRISHLIYPLHIAAVGGQPYRWLLLFSGVLVALLWGLGMCWLLGRKQKSG